MKTEVSLKYAGEGNKTISLSFAADIASAYAGSASANPTLIPALIENAFKKLEQLRQGETQAD